MTSTIGTTQLADRQAITDILHNHSRGLDRADSALIQDCYWPEAEVDYGSFKGPAHSFAELVVPALAGVYELTRHSIGNTVVVIEGDQARCESHVHAAHLFQGGEQEMRFDGRYLDTLEHRGGEWRMLHRQVVIDWSQTRTIADERDSDAFAALSRGSNGADDPSIAFLAGE